MPQTHISFIYMKSIKRNGFIDLFIEDLLENDLALGGMGRNVYVKNVKFYVHLSESVLYPAGKQ